VSLVLLDDVCGVLVSVEGVHQDEGDVDVVGAVEELDLTDGQAEEGEEKEDVEREDVERRRKRRSSRRSKSANTLVDAGGANLLSTSYGTFGFEECQNPGRCLRGFRPPR
jgi:hypothetical protein